MLSSANLKDSNATTLGSNSMPTLNSEDRTAEGLNGSGRFGWPREFERETSPSPNIERVLSIPAENNVASGYSGCYPGQQGDVVDMSVDDYDDSDDVLDQEKPSWITNRKAETNRIPPAQNNMKKNESQTKMKEFTDFSDNNPSSDDDLNALLKVRKLSFVMSFAVILHRSHNNHLVVLLLGRGGPGCCSQNACGGDHGTC